MRKSTAQKRKKRSLYVKRRNKRVKSALLVGISLGLLAIFLLIKSVLTPMVSAFSSNSTDLKDKSIYSVLLAERDENNLIKTISLLIVQKKDTKLYSVNIPPYTKVDLPGRLGEEEVSKVIEIASSLNDSSNENNLLIESVKKIVRFDIDRYLISDSESFNKVQAAIFNKDITVYLPWGYKSLSQGSRTNLSVPEIIDLSTYVRNLEARNIENIDLNQIADVDLKIRDISLSGNVAQESLGVVILNGTGVGNVAREVSLVAQNIGSRVSLVSNAENQYEKSYLVTNDPLSSTVIYLKNYYPTLNIISKETALSLGEDLIDRGDISIIVGFDILERMQ